MRSRRWALVFLLGASTLGGARVTRAQTVADSGPRVRSGFVVRPDTVEVGDPFLLIVRVSIPNGARIEWGSIDDTAAVVSMRSPVRLQTEEASGGRIETATYELAAWDMGQRAINMPDATVRIGAQSVPVPITGASVYVTSVLPGDTTLHVPKPAKGMFARVVPWWQAWWPALAVVLGLLLLWWLYRRRKRPAAARRAPSLSAFERAEADFERLERLALADAGERGRAVTIAVEIVRVYLRERAPAAILSLTSAELLLAIADDMRVPHDALRSLLAEADAIKFARRAVTSARELVLDARFVVSEVERGERQRAADELARAAAQQEADAEARRTDEDDARKRSRRGKAAA